MASERCRRYFLSGQIRIRAKSPQTLRSVLSVWSVERWALSVERGALSVERELLRWRLRAFIPNGLQLRLRNLTGYWCFALVSHKLETTEEKYEHQWIYISVKQNAERMRLSVRLFVPLVFRIRKHESTNNTEY